MAMLACAPRAHSNTPHARRIPIRNFTEGSSAIVRMRYPAPMPAHSSLASWSHGEFPRRPHRQCSHVSPAPIWVHPAHASWRYSGPRRRPN
eukprot:5626764-Pyramimonas_sp.AAC.1